jgi:hypothetical protein
MRENYRHAKPISVASGSGEACACSFLPDGGRLPAGKIVEDVDGVALDTACPDVYDFGGFGNVASNGYDGFVWPYRVAGSTSDRMTSGLAPPGLPRSPIVPGAHRTSRSYVLASLRALHLDLRLVTSDQAAAEERRTPGRQMTESPGGAISSRHRTCPIWGGPLQAVRVDPLKTALTTYNVVTKQYRFAFSFGELLRRPAHGFSANHLLREAHADGCGVIAAAPM